MTKISSLSALTGAGTDTAADLVPVVDMSEAGAARNKKMTFAEFAIALQEAFDDRMNAVLTEGSNVTITYDDGAGTITIAALSPVPGDISGLNEAIDDRVAALITAGSGISKSYNDGAGTLTLSSTASAIEVLDEGVSETAAVLSLDFVGSGVAANDDGSGNVTVTISGGATETTAAEFRAGTQAGEYISPDIAWDAAAYVALNDSGGNIAVDLSTGLNFTMTMDGDYTLSAPSNGKPGQTGVIVLTQDGTGTQTLAYNAVWKFAGGTDPVLSTAASAVDLLFYQVLPNGTDVYANLVKAIA